MNLEPLIQAAVAEGVRQALTGLNVQTAPATPLKLAYSIPEAAEATGMSEWCIRTAIRRGELPAKQAGDRGAYAVPADCLQAWLHGTSVPVTGSAHPGVRQRKVR